MTTPANNGPNGGANQPEDDDPFGYLYADGQANGAAPPPPGGGYGYPGPTVGGHPGTQPGVPRTSYNQVHTVGERRNAGQRGQVPQQQAPAYQAQYQAPETLQAGGYGVPAQGQPPLPPQHQTQPTATPGGSGGGNGSSRKGLLIAAVAVVAAVAVGIGAALTFGDDEKDKGKGQADKQTGGQAQSPAPQSSAPEPKNSPSQEAQLPKADAASTGFSLAGGAQVQTAIPGAKGQGGQYVGGLNAAGASVTWTLDLPKGGEYKLKMTYGVPGKDANMTLTTNGTASTRPINMKNFSLAKPGEWDKGWTNTYSIVQLKAGTNTIKISCETGNSCDVNLDQLWLERG
ncbi:CBM35 domain-containing protein [Streptomyces sp. NPDC090022]|uniref:CBM35 domain-containing protein n=1 Tax=Streptomyces sp. NPDC090022 TaxID=3365920 RepID=UPI00380CB223